MNSIATNLDIGRQAELVAY